MSSCSVFNKTLILDANLDSSNIVVDITKLRGLLGSFEVDTSGLWQPIVIKNKDSKAEYCEPLIMAGPGSSSSFSPCNCNDTGLDIVAADALETFQSSSFSCNYCGTSTLSEWFLVDNENNLSPSLAAGGCCSGACDTRMNKDDYLPKIPVLNQSYISGFLDFKYLQEFPACNNPGLGFERFITISSDDMASVKGADLCIDWKLKETIGEVPYNKITSQHNSQYDHDKSYIRSKLTSQTCGNFLLTKINTDYETEYISKFPRLSGLIGSTNSNKTIALPSIDHFQNTPHGFDKQTYNNIYIHNNKIASYWKWNYTSGIIGWYRYFDTSRTNDQRPIPGVDLYIPPGDIFFATNDGPEPSPTASTSTPFIKECPSGLKVVTNNALDCIIPSGSEFMYISANIYPQFYNIYNTLLSTNSNDTIKSLSQASLLATAPQYDKVTVDLNKDNILTDYIRNSLNQISGINKDMSVATSYDSVSNLYFISNKKELINTLANKYGAYLWIPPGETDKSITFTIPSQSDSFYIDLDFDMVMKKQDIKFRRFSCREINTCGSRNYSKEFYYDQRISIGSTNPTTLSTLCFDELRHKQTCSVNDAGVATTTKYDFNYYSTLYLNNSRIKSISSNSTCVQFLDSYPRIVDKDNPPTSFCSNCDQYSSYYIVQNVEDSLCKDRNFCFSNLARRFNNAEDPPGTRKERRVSDNSLRLKRSYETIAFNPHIDLVAFHKDNGVFFRSKSFLIEGTTVFDRLSAATLAGTPKISFDTYNVGIKIYALYAERLQSNTSSSWSCKRFPVELNTCKCYGLNVSDYSQHPYNCGGNSYGYADVFLPGLSTKNSPSLAKYGGYSQTELDNLFGNGVLTAGGSLPKLNNKIIPEQPYGCERSISISLKNYTNSAWTFVPDEFTTSHSDVWASVSEYGDPTAFYAKYTYDGFYFRASNNPEWKRFFTKVEIDGNTLWKDQILNIVPKGGTIPITLPIKLQNPYLEKLTGDKKYILAPPSGDLLSGTDYVFGQPVSYGDPGITSRGDEISTVNITFTNKPRKQILAFGINPPLLQGSLAKGFFHPNSGLTTDQQYHGQSPLKNNTIYYDKPLYDDSYDSGLVLIGDLTTNVQNTFNNISQFEHHRKPRLYLRINGQWYLANIPNRYGYIHKGYSFVGTPSYFEYVQNKQKSKNIPGLIPIPPKQHTILYFVGNHPNKPAFDKKRFDSNTYSDTPILFSRFNKSDKKSIIIPGSRYYFMIPETDPAISIDIASIDDISDLPEAMASQIKSGSMILLNDQTRWIYVGSNKTEISSYILTNYNYLYHNFSDLHIPYSLTNRSGYVYNSRKKTNHKVALYNARAELETNIILQKELFVEFDKPLTYANKKDSASVRVFTKLLLQNKPRDGYDIMDPLLLDTLSDPEVIEQYSLTVYVPVLWLRSENDSYLKSPQKTKWGDVLYYDGEALDALSNLSVDESYWYPTPNYKNTFYKLIVNNHLKNKHRYQLTTFNDNNTYTVDHNDLVYYNIHQKYSTNYDNNKFYSTNLDSYHNYLPFMDINLISVDTSAPVRSSLNSLIRSTDKPISGTLLVNSLHNELSDDYDWGSFINPNDSSKFWIHLANDTILTSVFVPNQIIYSTTLRIDDPVYWLNKTNKNTFIDNELSTNCSRIFNPSSNISTISTLNNAFLPRNMGSKTEIRRQAFYSQPVYCDTDQVNPENCGEQPCEIKSIGSVNLTSEFKIATSTSLPLQSIPLTIPYIISYDAGNYNPFGSQSLTTINRFEIDPDSWLDSDNSCSSTILKPLNLKNSIIDSRYQNALKTVDDHSLLVKQTDNMANEMLFRLMHGEKIPINKNILLKDNQSALTLSKLLSYSDPKITATDIYDEILYNYDRSAINSNVLYNSSLSIEGLLTIGKTISLTIGSVSINLSIVREISDNETSVTIQGTIGGENIYGKLYIEQYAENSLIVTNGAAAAPSPASDNDRITLVQTYTIPAVHSYSSYSWPPGGNFMSPGNGPACYGVGSQDGAPPPEGSTPGYWGKCPQAEGVEFVPRIPVAEPGCELLSNTTGKTWSPGAYSATVIVPPSVRTIQRTSESRCTDNFSPCKDFEYSYCRRKKDRECASCKQTFQGNDGFDFEYSFKMCRHNMSLYGNTYREQHFENVNSVPVIQQLADSAGGYNCGTPASPGLGRGCLGPRNDPRCAYVVGDIFGWVVHEGWCSCTSRTGADWTEYCVLKKCLSIPASSRKIYHRKTQQTLQPYDPKCPSQLCTITYNNYSVTITYPNVSISVDSQGRVSQSGTKTQCFLLQNAQQSCPFISITTLPADFIIQENIGSECSACNQLPVKLNLSSQTQSFATIKEKRRCILGSFIYGTINAQPLIAFGSSNLGSNSPVRAHCCDGVLDSAPCYGNGSSFTAQCGGGYEWFACLGSLSYSRNVNPDGGISHQPLKEILCEYSVPAMAEGPASTYQLDEWKQALRSSYGQSSRGRENNHIPESDIIEGLVPDSQSASVQFKTYSFASGKARPSADGTSVEVESWNLNVEIAYYEYEYIRKKTIQDVLKPPGVVCYNQQQMNQDGDVPGLTLPEPPEPGAAWDFVGQISHQYQCLGLGFPSWFRLPGWAWDYDSGGQPNLPATYLDTKTYTRSNGCANGIQQYYRHSEINRNSADWYAPPMPCSDTNWDCWAGQNLRSAFLTVKTGNKWV